MLEGYTNLLLRNPRIVPLEINGLCLRNSKDQNTDKNAHEVSNTTKDFTGTAQEAIIKTL